MPNTFHKLWRLTNYNSRYSSLNGVSHLVERTARHEIILKRRINVLLSDNVMAFLGNFARVNRDSNSMSSVHSVDLISCSRTYNINNVGTYLKIFENNHFQIAPNITSKNIITPFIKDYIPVPWNISFEFIRDGVVNLRNKSFPQHIWKMNKDHSYMICRSQVFNMNTSEIVAPEIFIAKLKKVKK